jgi:hypothetical protein
MKKLICYIPFFVGRSDAYDHLAQTLGSLKTLSAHLISVRVLCCQPEQEGRIATMAKFSDEIGSRFEPHFISVRNPVLLPTAAYRFMQTDGGANDPFFYIEGDHIVHAEEDFLDIVFREIESGSVVMPHRLGNWHHKGRESLRWENYYVGNYDAGPNIHPYSNNFNAMTGYYNAYAGAYFARRSVIQKYPLSFPLTTNIVWRGLVECARRFSGGILFGSQAPHGLLLEAPSLVFQANQQRVLKPCNIGNLHVIHLSRSGVV